MNPISFQLENPDNFLFSRINNLELSPHFRVDQWLILGSFCPVEQELGMGARPAHLPPILQWARELRPSQVSFRKINEAPGPKQGMNENSKFFLESKTCLFSTMTEDILETMILSLNVIEDWKSPVLSVCEVNPLLILPLF